MVLDDFREDELRRFVVNPESYLRGEAQLRVRRELLRALLPLVDGLSLIDIGCGDGSLSLQFVSEAQRLVLLDRSATMLERAKGKLQPGWTDKVEFVLGSLEEFDRPPADIVLCVGVLAYVADAGEALRRVSDLTRVGGTAVVQFTDADAWSRAIPRCVARVQGHQSKGYLLNSTSFNNVSKVAGAVGLQPVDCVRHWPLLPGMGRLPARLQHRYLSGTLHSGDGRGRGSGWGSETYVRFHKR